MVRLLEPAVARLELAKLVGVKKGIPRSNRYLTETIRRLARKRLLRLRGQAGAYWTRYERAGITEDYWNRLVSAYDNECAYCGPTLQFLTIDHVTPKFRLGSGGKDVVPACGSCNSRKQHRSLSWMLNRMNLEEPAFLDRMRAAHRLADGSTKQTDP
jgi:5-methylcytosine-specific restriction endonuclease McrA